MFSLDLKEKKGPGGANRPGRAQKEKQNNAHAQNNRVPLGLSTPPGGQKAEVQVFMFTVKPAETGFSPRTYSVAEAAAILGISRSLAHKLIREGRFPAKVIKVGERRYLVVRDSLDRLVAGDGQ